MLARILVKTVATLEDSCTARGDVLNEIRMATIAREVGLDLLTLRRAVELRWAWLGFMAVARL